MDERTKTMVNKYIVRLEAQIKALEIELREEQQMRRESDKTIIDMAILVRDKK